MSQYGSFCRYLRDNLKKHPESVDGILSLFIDMTTSCEYCWSDRREMLISSMDISDDIDRAIQEVIKKYDLEC